MTFDELARVEGERGGVAGLWIFPRIFEKIRNGPSGILCGWGETDSLKNLVKLSL